MKKRLFHVDYASPDEVLFRSPEDIGAFRNRLALRAFAHDVGLLAKAAMSDHFHGVIECATPAPFISSLRQSYTDYFNRRYGRSGRLGLPGFFCRHLQGPVQVVVALSYTLRNGLHHGVSPTPFAYAYSSANEMFRKERGLPGIPAGNFSLSEMRAMLPRHSAFPEDYEMDESGIFLRRSFMDIARAESFFVTPRNFLFQMNRISDERWVADQQRDDPSQPPVRLPDMEPFFTEASISRFLVNEKGWKYDPSRMTDLDVCALIDHDLVPRFGRRSVYELTAGQKEKISKELLFDCHLPAGQIRRCLVLPSIR